jgi:hypothetical protein
MHRNHVYILYINVILGCLDELWHVHQHVPIPTFNRGFGSTSDFGSQSIDMWLILGQSINIELGYCWVNVCKYNPIPPIPVILNIP